MGELTYIGRVADGLILVETWDNLSSDMTEYKSQAKQILRKLDRGPTKCSIDSTQVVFHYRIDNGVAYLTICHKNYPKKLAFAFLEELQQLFEEELKREFGNSGNGSSDYRSLINTIEKPYHFIKFDRVIQKKKMDYKDPNSSKALSKLNECLSEVTSIMRQNIDDILQRGENMEDVGRKAHDLKYASKEFSGMAKLMNQRALFKKYAPLVAIAFVFILFIYFYFSRMFRHF
eukprot:GHVL01036421.1.p1 GENE.GHVL01036421.1~~GHVL01036421.1.p1  ORF type:complete len:232 (-),score=31.22 GHVL01036421.1:227-922(-)